MTGIAGALDLERLGVNKDAAQSFGYTGGLLTSIVVTYAGATYTQTITYNGDNTVATISLWAKS